MGTEMTSKETGLAHLRDYYLRGLKEKDHTKFLSMIDEMSHLTIRDHVSTFALIYAFDMSIPRVVICSAVGYTQKAIDRGLR